MGAREPPLQLYLRSSFLGVRLSEGHCASFTMARPALKRLEGLRRMTFPVPISRLTKVHLAMVHRGLKSLGMCRMTNLNLASPHLA